MSKLGDVIDTRVSVITRRTVLLQSLPHLFPRVPVLDFFSLRSCHGPLDGACFSRMTGLVFLPATRLQAEEQGYRRHCEALREEEDKKADIYNHVTGDFLTEAKEQAESTRGPHKPLASRYKGMTADELRVFEEERALQLKEIEVTADG